MRSGPSSGPRCSCSPRRTRCSAAAPAGWRAARGPLAARACARAITCAGSARAARTWTCSPRRPILGGAGSARTPAVGSPGAATGPRAAGCVSCTGSGGTAPGDPTCTGGWPTRRRSRHRRRAWSAPWRTAICGRRRRCRSATPTPTPGRSTGDPTIDVFVRRFGQVATTAEEIIRLDRAGPAAASGDPVRAAVPPRRSGPPRPSPAVVMAVVRALAATGAVSLLDRTEDDWRIGIGRPAPRDSNLRALLIDARRKVVRPRRRRRLGGRVRPRRLAAAPPRVHRQPATRLHRDRAAVAARSGETVAALAARRPGSAWRPPAAGCAP